MPLRLATILLIAFPLGACASDSESARERAVSWSKTVEMIADQWDRGSIPTHYAQHAMGSASDAVHEALGAMRDEAAGQDDQAAGQLDSIAALSAAVDAAAAALAREDRQKTLPAAKEVHSAAGRLAGSQ